MGIDKHYSDLLGLDTRSNKLASNPKSARRGSKNFRYDFQDNLVKANGFHHKSNVLPSQTVGDVEYRFRDPNTGEEKTELLSVCQNGLLYKKYSHQIKFSSLGTATKYSFYYDGANFILTLGVYAPITVSQAMTMNQLKTAINALGATCTVVDDAGVLVANSTELAYLIDTVVDQPLVVGTVTKMSSWNWTEVDYPSKGTGLLQEVPFITTLNFFNDPDYEGISYVNLNNVIYITDGGFPMKYDGRSVYRAGMPKMLIPNSPTENYSGMTIIPKVGEGATSGLIAGKKYKYIFQYGFVDFQGSTIMGDYSIGTSPISSEYATTNQPTILDYINYTPGPKGLKLVTNPLQNGFNFPVISCRVSGAQDIPTAGGTINVDVGHNVKVGMLLRIPISNQSTTNPITPKNGYSILMAKVTAVTTNTITVASGLTGGKFAYARATYSLSGSTVSASTTLTVASITNIQVNDFVSGPGIDNTVPADQTVVVAILSPTTVQISRPALSTTAGTYNFNYTYSTLLLDTQVLNAGYAVDEYANQITNINYTNYWNPEIKFGAFVRLFRTVGDGSVFYRAIDLPLDFTHKTIDSVIEDIFSDNQNDTARGLSRIALDDSDQGSDLPRACKYLSSWQGQLVQAGRTVDPSLAEAKYPSAYYPTPLNDWDFIDNSYVGFKYTEAGLADFQSIYWNDVLTPEGFPQSGLFEQLIDTPLSDRVKGMGANKDAFFVFKDASTVILSGTLATQDLTQETLEESIGCANHRTVQSAKGALMWLDKTKGFYSCVAGRLPINIGYYISDEAQMNPDLLDFNKSFAQTFIYESLYLCVVDTKIFVYDYASIANNQNRSTWYMWNPFTVKSMVSSSDNYLLLNDGTREWKFKATNTKYDYSNHTSAVLFNWISAWLNYGVPTIDKHFVQTWINAIQGGFTLLVSAYGNYMDTLLGDKVLTFPDIADGKKTVKQEMNLPYPKQSGYSIGFSNEVINANVIIQGWELKLEEDFDKGDPKR